MGTALSLSPAKKPEKLALQEPHESRDEDEEVEKNKEQEEQDKKKRKRHPVLLHVLGWKKRLAAARAKRKGVKRGDVQCDPPNQTVHRAPKATHQSRQVLVPGPVPDQKSIISPRRVVVQASTGELLRCLSDFLCRRCIKLKELTSNQIILWFRNVDGALLFQGWQDQCFISPASLVFVYLLGREAVNEDTSSEQELHATFLTCLYLAYSYLGNEISYPLKPFLVESSRDAFWDRALVLIDRLSADMLRINADPHFFAEVFQDLKKQGGSRQKKKDGEKRDRERQGKSQKIKVKQEKENDGGKPFDGLDR